MGIDYIKNVLVNEFGYTLSEIHSMSYEILAFLYKQHAYTMEDHESEE